MEVAVHDCISAVALEIDFAGIDCERFYTQTYCCVYNNAHPQMKNRNGLQCSTQDDKVKPW